MPGSDDAPLDHLVETALAVANDVLRPAAETTDQSSAVPERNLEALARVGLYGLVGPVERGGQAASADTVRQVFEILAGACAVSFFVWSQHHSPVRLLAGSVNDRLREEYLGPLCRGDLLGGVAFAHLRRPGPPALAARPAEGGYQIDGEAPWVTSWGVAGFYAVAATVVGSDRVLFFRTAGIEDDGVRASSPMDLMVMGASRTVRLTFTSRFVPHADIISLVDGAIWRRRDRVTTAQPNPAAFGIAASCVARLRDAGVGESADRLGGALDDLRREAYGLADAGGTTARDLGALVRARAAGLDLATRAALALVAATGGRAMERSNPAQRHLREAAFFTIQAQTDVLRTATLQRLGGGAL